jgi:hypothetical protein
MYNDLKYNATKKVTQSTNLQIKCHVQWVKIQLRVSS